jgi:hypothetical protein
MFGPIDAAECPSLLGIYKALGAVRIWLTRGPPFVTWGPEPGARWYPTERMAQRILEALPVMDQEAAAIASLDRTPWWLCPDDSSGGAVLEAPGLVAGATHLRRDLTYYIH